MQTRSKKTGAKHFLVGLYNNETSFIKNVRNESGGSYLAVNVAMFLLKSLMFSGRYMSGSGIRVKLGAFLCDSTTRISRSMNAEFGSFPWSVAVARIRKW